MKKILIAGIFVVILLSFIYFIMFNKKEYKFVFESNGIKMEVFGTEYIPLQNGRVFVQLTDISRPDRYIENSICKILIVTPNLEIFTNSFMLYYSRGLYYYDFIVPPEDGVYMIDVVCSLPYGLEKYSPLNYQTSGASVSGYFDYSFEKDGLYFIVSGRNGNSITFNFPQVNTSNATSYYVSIYGLFDSQNTNYYLNVYAYNTCANNWQLIGTISYYSVTSTFELDKNCSNPASIRLVFPSIIGATTGFRIDEIKLYLVENIEAVITNIRGGGEVHVTGIEKMGKNPSIRILT